MKNSIFVIKPYRWNSQWVFDESERNLLREPFVAGADTMIDVATAHIPNAADGFLMIFSANPFPGAEIVLKWRREEMGGNTYFWEEKDIEGWLCPALLEFYNEAPKALYVQVKAVSPQKGS